MSPRSSSMFLFFLEQFPAGPCGCASGDHEVRTVTDITLSFHHFLTGDLLSSADWANNSTISLVLLRKHGWRDSKSRTTLFSKQHFVRERWHGASPCPLEWQGLLPNLLDTAPPPREQAQSSEPWGLENLLSVEGLFTCWEKKSSSRTPSLSPAVFVWRTLLLCGDFLFSWSMSSGVHSVSSPQTLRANVYLCNKWRN